MISPALGLTTILLVFLTPGVHLLAVPHHPLAKQDVSVGEEWEVDFGPLGEGLARVVGPHQAAITPHHAPAPSTLLDWLTGVVVYLSGGECLVERRPLPLAWPPRSHGPSTPRRARTLLATRSVPDSQVRRVMGGVLARWCHGRPTWLLTPALVAPATPAAAGRRKKRSWRIQSRPGRRRTTITYVSRRPVRVWRRRRPSTKALTLPRQQQPVHHHAPAPPGQHSAPVQPAHHHAPAQPSQHSAPVQPAHHHALAQPGQHPVVAHPHLPNITQGDSGDSEAGEESVVFQDDPYPSPSFVRTGGDQREFRHYQDFHGALGDSTNQRQSSASHDISHSGEGAAQAFVIPDTIVKDGQVFYRYDAEAGQHGEGRKGQSKRSHTNGVQNMTETHIHVGDSPDLDDGSAQANTQVSMGEAGQKATADAGSLLGPMTHVLGTAGSGGFFSAQAHSMGGPGGEGHLSHSLVMGNMRGAEGSAMVMNGGHQSLAQVQVGPDSSSTAQVIHQGEPLLLSVINATQEGGRADAQAQGPDAATSHAQMDFNPSSEQRVEDGVQGHGLASAMHSTHGSTALASLGGRISQGSYLGTAHSSSGTYQQPALPEQQLEAETSRARLTEASQQLAFDHALTEDMLGSIMETVHQPDMTSPQIAPLPSHVQPFIIDQGGLTVGSGLPPLESEVGQAPINSRPIVEEGVGMVGPVTYHHGELGAPPLPYMAPHYSDYDYTAPYIDLGPELFDVQPIELELGDMLDMSSLPVDLQQEDGSDELPILVHQVQTAMPHLPDPQSATHLSSQQLDSEMDKQPEPVLSSRHDPPPEQQPQPPSQRQPQSQPGAQPQQGLQTEQLQPEPHPQLHQEFQPGSKPQQQLPQPGSQPQPQVQPELQPGLKSQQQPQPGSQPQPQLQQVQPHESDSRPYPQQHTASQPDRQQQQHTEWQLHHQTGYQPHTQQHNRDSQSYADRQSQHNIEAPPAWRRPPESRQPERFLTPGQSESQVSRVRGSGGATEDRWVALQPGRPGTSQLVQGSAGQPDINIITIDSSNGLLDPTLLQNRVGRPLQPGERIPGSPGYKIPPGYRGHLILGYYPNSQGGAVSQGQSLSTDVHFSPSRPSSGSVHASVGGPQTSLQLGGRLPGVHASLTAPRSPHHPAQSSSASAFSTRSGPSVGQREELNRVQRVVQQASPHSLPSTAPQRPATQARPTTGRRAWTSGGQARHRIGQGQSRGDSLDCCSQKSQQQRPRCQYIVSCFIVFSPFDRSEVCKPTASDAACCCSL